MTRPSRGANFFSSLKPGLYGWPYDCVGPHVDPRIEEKDRRPDFPLRLTAVNSVENRCLARLSEAVFVSVFRSGSQASAVWLPVVE